MSIEIDETEDNLFVCTVESCPVPKKWLDLPEGAEDGLYAAAPWSADAMRQLRDLRRDQRRQHAQS